MSLGLRYVRKIKLEKEGDSGVCVLEGGIRKIEFDEYVVTTAIRNQLLN